MTEKSLHVDHIPLNKPAAVRIPLTLLPYLLTTLVAGASTYALLGYRTAALERQTEKIITQREQDKNDITEMKSDMKWIKESLTEIKRLLRK